MLIRIRQAVVVEGKYDKIKLASLVDATINETGGFQIYKNPEKMELLRMLAKKCGLLILTDSDAAGLQIRNYLKSAIPKEQMTHIYLPDLFGKEKRKKVASKEGKLGVEGMPADLLREALAKAGISNKVCEDPKNLVTKADFFEWGLCGGPDSSKKRRELQKKMGLPERISSGTFLEVINTMYSREELIELLLT